MEQHRPRHIRDIAHLYLSRQKPVVRLVELSANSAGSFPGFHAANLAVAFARAGYTVRLFELSGLIPDSCYFLALPAEVCFGGLRHRFGPVNALSGITVFFEHQEMPPPAGGGAGVVDLVHRAPDAASSGAKADTILTILDTETAPRLDVLASGPDGPVAGGLGGISRWREALRDRVPVALRDPGSLLARQYDTVCTGVIATWRNNVEYARKRAPSSARIG